jgi:uncharacterized protein (UPF0335 family)
MNSIRSLFHPDNHDDTNQHLLKTHEPKKRDNTTKKSVTIRDPITGSSNALPYIDNTLILARPSTIKHAFADVSTNTGENSPISHSQSSHSGKARANENNVVETSIRRMNEEISELEDQSVNIYTEVKKISYNVSLINTRQIELISRLGHIEEIMKQIDKYFTG